MARKKNKLGRREPYTPRVDIDKNSATWLAIQGYLLRRIASHRAEIETPGLDMVNTELTRGRLDEARHILKLVMPPEVVEEAEAGFDAITPEE